LLVAKERNGLFCFWYNVNALALNDYQYQQSLNLRFQISASLNLNYKWLSNTLGIVIDAWY
jgi:hypothetical protein